MSKKFFGSVAVKGIVRHEGKVLLIQNAYDHMWQLPGGRMHVDEMPEEALVREIQEELNIIVTPHSILKADVFENTHVGSCLLLIYVWDVQTMPEMIQSIDPEIEDCKWVTQEELGTLTIWQNYIEPIKQTFSN